MPLISIEQDRLASMWIAISRETGVARHFIAGPSRRAMIVFARAVAIRVMRDRHRMSWPAIGRQLGRRHWSVLGLDQRRRRDPEVLSCARRVSQTAGVQPSPPASNRAEGAPSAEGSRLEPPSTPA